MKKPLENKITLLLIFFLISCGKSDQQIKETILKEKNEQLETVNKEAIINLTQKYNSVLGWDSLKQYTYLYQEMFVEQRKTISFEGELSDITKIDSTYYLNVRNTKFYYNKNYIALIALNRQKFIELQNILKSNNHTNEGCFVFRVSKIVSASPEIKSDIESDGEDFYSYINYDFNNTLLIFKGDLIDFYLNETADKSND